MAVSAGGKQESYDFCITEPSKSLNVKRVQVLFVGVSKEGIMTTMAVIVSTFWHGWKLDQNLEVVILLPDS